MTARPLLLGRVVPRTGAEGPGTRYAVWVQGCSIRCVGCFNPHLWAKRGGTARAAKELVAEALAAGVEGVTLLGGEPFEQAEAAAAFASASRDAGLSVMVFTGYTLDALTSDAAPPGSAALLEATDLLVDGPYRQEFPDHDRPWVGSTNQGFHFLTDRYRELALSLQMQRDRIELRVSVDGFVSVNGWAELDALNALLADTARIPRGRKQLRLTPSP